MKKEEKCLVLVLINWYSVSASLNLRIGILTLWFQTIIDLAWRLVIISVIPISLPLCVSVISSREGCWGNQHNWAATNTIAVSFVYIFVMLLRSSTRLVFSNISSSRYYYMASHRLVAYVGMANKWIGKSEGEVEGFRMSKHKPWFQRNCVLPVWR